MIMIAAFVDSRFIRLKCAVQQRKHCIISFTSHARINSHVKCLEFIDHRGTDTATDNCINAFAGKEGCQSTMAGSICANNNGVDDLIVFNLINSEVLCLSEMLPDLSGIVSYSYSHIVVMSLIRVSFILCANIQLSVEI